MKSLLLALFTLVLLGAPAAHGYEFKLHLPTSGGVYWLTVAGYEFNGSTVAGDCSYYTVTAGSGRGGRSTRTNHYNSCTWDLYGNLISVTPVSTEPVAPTPVSQTGTVIVYAVSGSSSTGKDTRGFGFVNTPSSHYTWQTPSGYADIPDAVYTITATLTSDGDFPLTLDSATVTAAISSTYDASAGTATVTGNTCGTSVAVGATCSITVSYDPTTIRCTASPYGFAYTKIDLSLVTDAGANTDFTEGFTVMGVPLCDD